MTTATAKFTIKHKITGETLYECDAESMRAAVEAAVQNGANLNWANLYGANLCSANLCGAKLNWASFYGANLDGASFDGANLNWQSHALIAEILRRNAGDDVKKRMVAGMILISRDWRWDDFLSLKIDRSLRKWALTTLAQHVREDDRAPEVLQKLAPKSDSEEVSE